MKRSLSLAPGILLVVTVLTGAAATVLYALAVGSLRATGPSTAGYVLLELANRSVPVVAVLVVLTVAVGTLRRPVVVPVATLALASGLVGALCLAVRTLALFLSHVGQHAQPPDLNSLILAVAASAQDVAPAAIALAAGAAGIAAVRFVAVRARSGSSLGTLGARATGCQNRSMTSPSPFGRPGALPPTPPRGEVLGTYDTYPEAQHAVNRLAEADFDVSSVAIVGSDLKTIERVTGRMSWGRAAGAGAASGAWLGLFFGILLFLFSPSGNFTVEIAAILIGAAFGLLFGIVGYAINRRTRDYTSATQVLASNYQVLIPGTLIVRAQELLARPDTPR